jgi:hypothetical protein
MGPFLIFCSEVDKLAPYRSVCNSAQTLADLGGDVRLVKWSSSHHIGMFRSSLLNFIQLHNRTFRKVPLLSVFRVHLISDTLKCCMTNISTNCNKYL